jgi:hypothetical protein
MSDVDAYHVAQEAVRLLGPEEIVDLQDIWRPEEIVDLQDIWRPEEIVDLQDIWQSYRQDPVTPAELAERGALLGSGLGSSLLEWAPLVVAFLGTEIFVGAAVDSAKDGIRRGIGTL